MKHNYLKSSFLILAVIFCTAQLSAQDFTWMKGSDDIDQQATYGTLGTAAQANTPGAREGMVTIKDANGNFWMFGGLGYDAASPLAGYLNDLWKYNAITNEWTWVKGSSNSGQLGIYGTMGTPAAANCPGGRAYSSGWADPFGNLWIFGGRGLASGGAPAELNDLWRYNIANNQWTWMKGSTGTSQTGVYGTLGLGSPTNTPGARLGAASWTDNAGNLWLFGGAGYGSSALGDLSDLWRYSPVNDVWSWVKGTGTVNQYGSYGTMGTASLTNNPGGRAHPTTWKDATGNLWMFGGLGRANAGPQDPLGDLWQYDVVANHWTWMKGYNTVTTQQSVYGLQDVYAPTNLPGSRYGGHAWRDGTGDLWLLGGLGFDGGTTSDNLNDLWRYNPATNQWKWVKGSITAGQAGFYGIQGSGTVMTYPGARFLAGGWMDSSNNLYLFGGQGVDSDGNISTLNDVWKLMNCIGPTLTVTSTGSAFVCLGQTATLTASGASTYTWNFNQTVSPSITVSPQGSSSYSVFGTDLYGCKDTIEYTQNVVNLPILLIQYGALIVCPGQTATLSALGANSYTWSSGQTDAIITVTPSSTTDYTVFGTDMNGCVGTIIATQSVGCVGIDGRILTEETISIYPNPNNGVFHIKTTSTEKSHFVLMNALGQTVMELELSENETLVQPEVSKGIYYYRVEGQGALRGSGKIVVN